MLRAGRSRAKPCGDIFEMEGRERAGGSGSSRIPRPSKALDSAGEAPAVLARIFVLVPRCSSRGALGGIRGNRNLKNVMPLIRAYTRVVGWWGEKVSWVLNSW